MIGLHIEPPVATVLLERPPVNAIDEMWSDRLARVLDEAEARDDVTVLHLRSAQKVFSAGADLKMVRELLATPEGRDTMIGIIRGFQAVFARLERSRLVSVAELSGAAVGGGLELALACDFRVAGEAVKLGLPEARLGLLPGAGGTQRLTRLCGDALARRLILGAEVVSGLDAASLGLVHWALPADELEAWTRDLVERLSGMPGPALSACKACIGAALDPAADGFERELAETRRLHDVPETRRRVTAFLEKTA